MIDQGRPKTIILLNGPPSVGKTTIGNILRQKIDMALYTAAGNHRDVPLTTPLAYRFNMADSLKSMTHALYGLPQDPDFLENVKDVPCEAMGGMTPRQNYIEVSENFMKTRHGAAVFGEIFVARVKDLPPGSCVITADTGFSTEIVPIVREFGAENIMLVRLHRDNKDFSKDSRKYVGWEDVVRSSRIRNEAPYPIGAPLFDLSSAKPFCEFDFYNPENRKEVAVGMILAEYRKFMLAEQPDDVVEPSI